MFRSRSHVGPLESSTWLSIRLRTWDFSVWFLFNKNWSIILKFCSEYTTTDCGHGWDALQVPTNTEQWSSLPTCCAIKAPSMPLSRCGNEKFQIFFVFLMHVCSTNTSKTCHTYPIPFHPCHLVLQRCVFTSEQLGLTLRLLPPSALTGELSLQGAERLSQWRLLLLTPGNVRHLGTVWGSVWVVLIAAQTDGHNHVYTDWNYITLLME